MAEYMYKCSFTVWPYCYCYSIQYLLTLGTHFWFLSSMEGDATVSDVGLCVCRGYRVRECTVCAHAAGFGAKCLCVLVGDVGSVEVRSSLGMSWAGSASSGWRLRCSAIDGVWVPFVCPVGVISVPRLRDWSVSVSVERQSDTDAAASLRTPPPHTHRKASCHQTSSFLQCFGCFRLLSCERFSFCLRIYTAANTFLMHFMQIQDRQCMRMRSQFDWYAGLNAKRIQRVA